MATVVDSLIVTLGLDPTNFNKSRKDAAQALLQTKREFERTGRDITDRSKVMGDFMSRLRGNVLMMFAAFAGGRGIKQFVQDITNSNAMLGRLAPLIGTTTRELSRWQGAVTSLGGDARGVTSSIAALDRALVDISLVPTDNPALLPYLRALGISLEGANGKIKTAAQLLPELNAAIQGLDKREAASILAKIGLNEDLINVVMLSREEFRKTMADQERWGLVTEEQAKASMRFQRALASVTLSFTTLGRIVLEAVSPALESMATRLSEVFVWFQNHPEEAKRALLGIVGVVGALTLALGGPITWIAAIATAAAVLYDDWATWNETGKSNFGNFWQSVTEGWNKIREVAMEVWNDIKGWAEPVLQGLIQYFLDLVDTYRDGLKLIVSLFFGTSDDIQGNWKKLMDSLNKMWNNLWDGLGRALYNAAPVIYDAMVKAFGAAFDWVVDRANTIWRAITGSDLITKGNGPKLSGDQAGDMSQTVVGGTTSTPDQVTQTNTSSGGANVKEFIKTHYDAAKKISEETGVPVERILAQAGLESGWRTAPGNNFFGIKAGQSYTGKTQLLNTTEDFGAGLVNVPQSFRKYDTAEESFRDWAKLLEQKNFKAAKTPGLSDQQYAATLKAGGYATDKDYTSKLSATIAMTRKTMLESQTTPSPGTSAAAGGTTNNTANAQVTVVVPGGDAKAIATAIKPELEDAMQAAQQQGGYN